MPPTGRPRSPSPAASAAAIDTLPAPTIYISVDLPTLSPYRLTADWPQKTDKTRHMRTEPAIGDNAPDFDLKRDGGGTASLADFTGRKLVIYIYPRADTPGCTRESI